MKRDKVEKNETDEDCQRPNYFFAVGEKDLVS